MIGKGSNIYNLVTCDMDHGYTHIRTCLKIHEIRFHVLGILKVFDFVARGSVERTRGALSVEAEVEDIRICVVSRIHRSTKFSTQVCSTKFSMYCSILQYRQSMCVHTAVDSCCIIVDLN